MELINTTVDWSMAVIVWLVQLIIYPGFRRIRKEQFVEWHGRYMKIAGYVIAPLMIAQLGFAIEAFVSIGEWTSREALYALLVVLTWIVTFRVFVPIHGSLQERGLNLRLVGQLVSANWMRTFLWNVIVFVSP